MFEPSNRIQAAAVGLHQVEMIRDDMINATSEVIAALNANWIMHTNEIEDLLNKQRCLESESKRFGEWAQGIISEHRLGGQQIDAVTLVGKYRDAASKQAGTWSLDPGIEGSLEALQRMARSEIVTGQSKLLLGAGHFRTAANFAAETRVAAETFASDAVLAGEAISKLELDRATRSTELLKEFEDTIANMQIVLQDNLGKLHPGAASWDSVKWLDWSPSESHGEVLIGHFQLKDAQVKDPTASVLEGFQWPVYGSLRRGLMTRHNESQREQAHNLAQALMLRAVASSRPGDIRLTIFDPTGLGQSAQDLLELAEYDRELIGGKVWTSAEDLKRVLGELSRHMELVIQKYLRTEFESIEDFNQAAGEVAEPYRMLVVFDYPERFDEDSRHELRRIIENGPRCGIGVLLLHNTDIEDRAARDGEPLPGNWNDMSLPVRSREEQPSVLLNFIPDSDEIADRNLVRRIIEAVGEGARASQNSAVSFDKLLSLFAQSREFAEVPSAGPVGGTEPTLGDPSSWWTKSARSAIVVPVGQRGARDVASMSIDSRAHTGALLVGRPGSGKSTLLHSVICGASMLYGPDELELHLIDFREGVEFKVYAAERLPHAKSVAVESDREFGLSVLQYLQSEIERRGSLMRGSDGSNASLEALRSETGEKLPRILLVFDEFQVLFEKNDKLGAAAASLLEGIVRQGRGFGVHVLLGSQSLSGLDALGSHVLQLLPVRILLPATEIDAFRVLGEHNTEGTQLTESGDGILNSDAGSVEANERFRGALFDEAPRREFVRHLRELADDRGFIRDPIVFEGNEPIPIGAISQDALVDELRGAGPRQLRLRVGTPMSMSGTADIEMRREQGANLIAVARDETGGTSLGITSAFSLPRALFVHAVLDAAAQGAEVEVADFMSIDDGVEELLSPLTESNLVSINRRRQVPDVLSRFASEVRRRVEEDDTGARTLVLGMFGMHRARDFDQNSMDVDDAETLLNDLSTIVTDGPEFGVHALFTFDTVASVSKRLPSRIVRECSWRVAGQMSSDDSQDLLGIDGASSLRPHQFLVGNEDRGVSKRCSAIDLPHPDWWTDYLKTVMTVRENSDER